MLSPFINAVKIKITGKIIKNIHGEVGTWTFLQVISQQ